MKFWTGSKALLKLFSSNQVFDAKMAFCVMLDERLYFGKFFSDCAWSGLFMTSLSETASCGAIRNDSSCGNDFTFLRQNFLKKIQISFIPTIIFYVWYFKSQLFSYSCIQGQKHRPVRMALWNAPQLLEGHEARAIAPKAPAWDRSEVSPSASRHISRWQGPRTAILRPSDRLPRNGSILSGPAQMVMALLWMCWKQVSI